MAHALFVLTNLENDELLCPFAIVTGLDGTEMLNFEADTQDEAIASGKRYLDNPEPGIKAVALARDGRSLGVALQYIDVVSVSVRDVAGGAESTFSQSYALSDGLRLLGKIEFLLGVEAEDAEVQRSAINHVIAGMRSHPTAGNLIAALQASCAPAPKFLENTGDLH